jgi:hypothetical protein
MLTKKKKQNKKNPKTNQVGKHYSNPQYFVRKATAVILNQHIIKKNIIDKDNFEKKNHLKKTCGETL